MEELNSTFDFSYTKKLVKHSKQSNNHFLTVTKSQFLCTNARNCEES